MFVILVVKISSSRPSGQNLFALSQETSNKSLNIVSFYIVCSSLIVGFMCVYIYDIWYMIYLYDIQKLNTYIYTHPYIYIHILIYICTYPYIYVHIKHRIEVIFHWMSGQDQLLESRCWRFVSRRGICSAVGEWMRAQLRRCRVGHGVQLGRRCKRFLGVLMAGKSLQNGGFSGKVMYKRWLNGKMIRHPRSYQRLAHMDSQNEVKYINRFSNKRGFSRGICNIRGK